ncbi:nucleoside-diphosphate-sugar epimerase [Candidatus Magnetobacterium bavaricum]|uniref:Nucleoside-diphosphate-sugar epimerase n=1 Tax=Candidatus Magnetobacterium bavaricum TaxID=29290 RepID=A0A0F3GMY6_9BACT|nr:nucleoside-diphosphate-sugar epimerase [Candidatus Magnetobacterium bavaricum]
MNNNAERKKVLVTGSTGFVGRALKNRLENIGYIVIGLNRDITIPDTFKELKDQNIYYVFHLAAKTVVTDSWESPFSFYNTNIIGTANVLDYCRHEDIDLTFISAYIYGIHAEPVISEDCTIRPNNPYAHSKYLAEQLCEFYAKEFNVRINIVRPFNVYGIGQSCNFIIPYIIKQAINNKYIRVKDLSPKRDYVYLEDFIDACILCMDVSRGYSVYNIGSGY